MARYKLGLLTDARQSHFDQELSRHGNVIDDVTPVRATAQLETIAGKLLTLRQVLKKAMQEMNCIFCV